MLVMNVTLFWQHGVEKSWTQLSDLTTATTGYSSNSTVSIVIDHRAVLQLWMTFAVKLKFCYREKPVLTPCWNCFSDPFFITFLIIIIHNGPSQRSLSLCLNVKVPCLTPSPSVEGRKKEINTSPAWGLPFQEIFARLMAFLLCFLTFPLLWSIKEPEIQSHVWLFWDISLTSPQSAGLQIKSYFLPQHLVSDSLACCTVSRASLDLVTIPLAPAKTN